MNSTHGSTGDESAGGSRVHREPRGESHNASRGDRGHTQGFDRDQAEREAREAIGNARDELRALLEKQKNAAANQVHAVADALRQTEDSLRDKEQTTVAAYVGDVASRIDYWSDRLGERHIETLGRDIQNLANQRPGLFIAGTLAVGFIAIRFLKSTQAAGQQQTSRPPDDAPAGSSSHGQQNQRGSSSTDSPSQTTKTGASRPYSSSASKPSQGQS